MTATSNVFAPAQFLQNLAKGHQARPASFSGMVKPVENDNTRLMFAHGTNCKNWTPISTSAIDTIEVLDQVPCADHTHPFVRIVFKAPTTDEGKLFASLASEFETAAKETLMRLLSNHVAARAREDGSGERPNYDACIRCIRGCGRSSNFFSCVGGCADICPG